MNEFAVNKFSGFVKYSSFLTAEYPINTFDFRGQGNVKIFYLAGYNTIELICEFLEFVPGNYDDSYFVYYPNTPPSGGGYWSLGNSSMSDYQIKSFKTKAEVYHKEFHAFCNRIEQKTKANWLKNYHPDLFSVYHLATNDTKGLNDYLNKFYGDVKKTLSQIDTLGDIDSLINFFRNKTPCPPLLKNQEYSDKVKRVSQDIFDYALNIS